MRYGFIYETIYLKTMISYIGRHKRIQSAKDPDDSWYIGSGVYLWEAIENNGGYNPEDFIRIILKECDNKEDLIESEKSFILERNAVLSPLYYNASYGGEDSIGDIIYGRIAINNGVINKFINKEDVGLYLEQGYTLGSRELSEEHRKHLSDAIKLNGGPWNKGKEMTEEFCNKIRESWNYRDRFWSDEIRSKIMISRSLYYSNPDHHGSTYGKLVVSKNDSMKFINPEELFNYKQDGWVEGPPDYIKEIRREAMLGDRNILNIPGVRDTHKRSVKEAMNRPEVKEKLLASGARLSKDEEFKKKISDGRLGDKNPCYNKIWITNDIDNKRVYEEDFITVYQLQGYRRGRKVSDTTKERMSISRKAYFNKLNNKR